MVDLRLWGIGKIHVQRRKVKIDKKCCFRLGYQLLFQKTSLCSSQ